METLFRFSLKRSAIEQDESFPSIALELTGEFGNAVEAAHGSDNPRAAMKTAARDFVAGDDFVHRVTDLNWGDGLEALNEALNTLLDDGSPIDPGGFATLITNAMGADPAGVVRGDNFFVDRMALHNTIIAIKLLPEEHRRPLHHLVRALRDLEVVDKAASDGSFPHNPATLERYRQRSLRLPDVIRLGSIFKPAEPDGEQQGENEAGEQEIGELIEQFDGLERAIDELAATNSVDLLETESPQSETALPPADLRPGALFSRSVNEQTGLAGMFGAGAILSITDLGDSGGTSGAGGGSNVASEPGGSNPRVPFVATQALMAKSAGTATLLTGRDAFLPQGLADVAFRLNDNAANRLSQGTRELLQSRNLSVTGQSLDEVVDILEDERSRISDRLDALGGQANKYSFKRVGNTLVTITSPVATSWTFRSLGPLTNLLPRDVLFPPSVPRSHGEIAPAGVTDLMVVKQQLKGYEAQDISHVENVLQGESKHREHRRRRETVEFTLRETETTTSEERDLESTERFEMSRETEKTVKEESSVKAGLTISGKYGPTVEFSASAEGAMSRTREEAVKTASNFSQEVTERSSRKVTERVLQRESLRVTNEVEDINEHGVDNSAGEGHVIGIYQWLNKLYEAQVFNYGKRTIYDFMVAEPAAFLIESIRKAQVEAVELKKPIPFELRPDQIKPGNYNKWVLEYEATDVDPPPELFRTKSFDFSAGGGDDKTNYNHSGQVQIDDGYKAINVSAAVLGNIWDDDAVADIAVGRRVHRFSAGGGWVWTAGLNDERGTVPLALTTYNKSNIGVAVEVKCKRTSKALDQWRHDTHAKLTQAYRARQTEYEEKLASLQAEADVSIEGRNPGANEEIMNDELKKACVSILTDQHYGLFNAIENGSNGLPQLNLSENEAEGPYVRFFEQAFEWQHMTWVTYPYFWGRKSEWTSRIAFEDADPLFNNFLKAGYCRVTVPVRPGFEAAVDHFMNFGELWNGGPLPHISDDLYLPIADELAERLDRPGDEVPEGEPWTVRLPTSLVKLRQDGSLPTWRKNEDGDWVPE